MTLDQKLEEIEKRIDQATPGPWRRVGHFNNEFHPNREWSQELSTYPQSEDENDFEILATSEANTEKDRENFELISHAPEDLRLLLAIVRVQREALEALCDNRCHPEHNPCGAREALARVDELLKESGNAS